MIHDTSTVGEAKEFLRKNFQRGVGCPCCKQFVKQYKRPMTSSMAWAFLLVYRHMKANPQLEWLHVQNFLKPLPIPAAVANTGDFSKLKHWGLIEEKLGIRDDLSSRVGYYRVTDKGRMFAEGKLTVPKRVKLYNQEFFGFEGNDITIQDALGKRFDFNEILNG